MVPLAYPQCPFWCAAPGPVLRGGYVWMPRMSRDGRDRVGLAWHIRQVFVETATCPEVRNGHRFHLVAELDDVMVGKDGWAYAIMGQNAMRYALKAHYALVAGCSVTDPQFVIRPRWTTGVRHG